MSVSDNNMSGSSHDPEQIDLIDLLVQLWRGKVTIVIAIVIAIVLAVGYLAVAKEKWTSTAIITQPDVGQIATYNNALNVLYGVSAPKVTELQANVIGRFSTSFSALAETLDNQEKPEKLSIEQSVKGNHYRWRFLMWVAHQKTLSVNSPNTFNKQMKRLPKSWNLTWLITSNCKQLRCKTL